MKISKSKQELARIISENGGWGELSEWAVQDKSGEFGEKSVVLFEGGDKPVIEAGKSEWVCAEGYESDSDFGKHVCNADKLVNNWHQTILSREEYFHLYPAPDADGWIEWKSPFYGSMPCDEDAEVDIKVGDEIYYRYVAKCWKHWGSSTAYRLHKQVKPESCESVTRTIPEPDERVWTNPPTIEQLASDYRNRKDYADSKQMEADAAKADADEALRNLELAGEAIGLIVTPVRADKEPELVITNYHHLHIGDILRCKSVPSGAKCKVGDEGSIKKAENTPLAGGVYVEVSGSDWFGVFGEHWEFIRRP